MKIFNRRNYAFNLASRILIIIIFLLGILILNKFNKPLVLKFKNNLFNKSFNFIKVNKISQRFLGKDVFYYRDNGDITEVLSNSFSSNEKEMYYEKFYKCDTENGELRVSSKHGRTEKKENVRVGTYLANKHGYKIDLIENPPNVKSADSYNHTLGITQEYKVNIKPTKSSIDNLIRKGAKQSDNIVLVIDSNLSMSDLSNALNDRVKRTSIKSVTVVIDNKDKTYSFEEITTNGFLIKKADLK